MAASPRDYIYVIIVRIDPNYKTAKLCLKISFLKETVQKA